MKKFTSVFLLAVLCALTQAQPRQLKKVMELKMPKEDYDLNNGVKGASVCWHPVEKKYYAVFSGSKDYPLGVYDAAGKLLTDTSVTAIQDVRGLWYNPATKRICGNAGNNGGWFYYILNNKGVPTAAKTAFTGMKQPDENSAGAYDAISNDVYFLDGGKVSYYNSKAVFTSKTAIHWGQPKVLGPAEFENEDNGNNDYNQTTVVNSGIATMPIGLLNVKRNRIELYDAKEGYLQQLLLLPDGDFFGPRYLGFAYSNGIYWLYNIDNRTWLGFK